MAFNPKAASAAVAMRSALLLAALLAALALAGCSASNGPDGQSAAAQGSLAYNGASSGSQSHTFTCGASGHFSLSSNLGSGSVTITVKDGAGKSIHTKTVDGPGQSSEDTTITGASGTWEITATRAAGFSGQYAANVSC